MTDEIKLTHCFGQQSRETALTLVSLDVYSSLSDDSANTLHVYRKMTLNFELSVGKIAIILH